jgi:hypothetical protein
MPPMPMRSALAPAASLAAAQARPCLQFWPWSRSNKLASYGSVLQFSLCRVVCAWKCCYRCTCGGVVWFGGVHHL